MYVNSVSHLSRLLPERHCQPAFATRDFFAEECGKSVSFLHLLRSYYLKT